MGVGLLDYHDSVFRGSSKVPSHSQRMNAHGSWVECNSLFCIVHSEHDVKSDCYSAVFKVSCVYFGWLESVFTLDGLMSLCLLWMV